MNLNPDFVESILDRYEDDFAVHHARPHIVRMLQGFDFCIEKIRMNRGFQGEPFFSRLDLMMGEAAILFHDIAASQPHSFIPEEHEKRSAEEAIVELSQFGWDSEDIRTVGKMIEATCRSSGPFVVKGNNARRNYNLMEISELICDLNVSDVLNLEALKKSEKQRLYELSIHERREDMLLLRLNFYRKAMQELKDRKFFKSELFNTDANNGTALKNIAAMIEDGGKCPC